MESDKLIKRKKDDNLSVKEIAPGKATVSYNADGIIYSITNDDESIKCKLDEMIIFKLLMDIENGQYDSYKFDKTSYKLNLSYLKKYKYCLQLSTNYYRQQHDLIKDQINQITVVLKQSDYLVKLTMCKPIYSYDVSGRLCALAEHICYGKIDYPIDDASIIQSLLEKINSKQSNDYKLIGDMEKFLSIDNDKYSIKLVTRYWPEGQYLMFRYGDILWRDRFN